jgi:hypothetical protein
MLTSARNCLLVATLALVACSPTLMSRAELEVTGEFLPMERCSVTTPRGDFGPPQKTQTFYDFGGIAAMAPAGYTVHTIRCRGDSGH